MRCCLLEAAAAYWLVQLASLLLVMGDTCQQARTEQSVSQKPTFAVCEISSLYDVRVFCVDEPVVMGKYVSARNAK